MPRLARHARARRAFTLLEAIAALVVVGLGASAALGAVASAVRTESRLEHVLVAEALGQQRLAVVRLLSREQLLRLPDSLARGAFAPPFERYRWRAAATLVPHTPDLFTIAVVIEWEDASYALETRHYNPRDALRGR